MDYRCPHCRRMLDVRKLYLKDISACARCGQKVVLGDFLAFAMAAFSMPRSTWAPARGRARSCATPTAPGR